MSFKMGDHHPGLLQAHLLVSKQAAGTSITGELVYGFETGNPEAERLLGIRRPIRRLSLFHFGFCGL